MKKRFLWVLIIVIFICGISPYVYADTMFTKLGSGLLSIDGSPLETSLRPCRVLVSDKIKPNGLAASVFRGIGFTIGRMLAGVYDVATFPLPIPFGYKSIYQPKTVFDGFSWAANENWPFPRFGFGRQADPPR